PQCDQELRCSLGRSNGHLQRSSTLDWIWTTRPVAPLTLPMFCVAAAAAIDRPWDSAHHSVKTVTPRKEPDLAAACCFERAEHPACQALLEQYRWAQIQRRAPTD